LERREGNERRERGEEEEEEVSPEPLHISPLSFDPLVERRR